MSIAPTTTPAIRQATRSAKRQRAVGGDDGSAAFLEVRPQLLGVAQRVLGDRSEAEDIVQEAWLRWQNCDRSRVDSPTAFLITTTRRLAINLTQTARARHESPVDTWVGDVPSPAEEPSVAVERREDLEHGMRTVAERLSPSERAAFVLRKAFAYPYATIAGLLRSNEANVRQLVHRADRHLRVPHRRPIDESSVLALTDALSMAARTGDMTELETLLVTAASGHTARSRGGRYRDLATHSTAGRPLGSHPRHTTRVDLVTSLQQDQPVTATPIGDRR
jgi:RNA polymerase sigma-70 factor (ECF subfamily)